MIRSFFRVLFGFVLSVLVAGAVQVMFARPPASLVGLPFVELRERLEVLAMLTTAVATHMAIFAAIFAAIAIPLAEWFRLRSAGYYVITGLGIGIAGFLAQFAAENAVEPTIVNTYALLAYVVTGLVGGTTYWLAAGRHAGGRPGRADYPGPSRRIRTEDARGSDADEAEVTTSPKAGAKATSVPTTHGSARLRVA